MVSSEKVQNYLLKLAELQALPDNSPEWDALAEELDSIWYSLSLNEIAEVNDSNV